MSLSIGIALGAIVANAIAYVAYRSLAGPDSHSGGVRVSAHGDDAIKIVGAPAALNRSGKAVSPTEPPPVSPTPSADDSKASARARKKEIRSRRAQKRRKAPLILVTTVPPRLTVEVDGKIRGRSPVRLLAKPGVRIVKVIQGDRTLYTRRISVAPGDVVHIRADVADQLHRPVLGEPETDTPKAVVVKARGTTPLPVKTGSVSKIAVRRQPDPRPILRPFDPPPSTQGARAKERSVQGVENAASVAEKSSGPSGLNGPSGPNGPGGPKGRLAMAVVRRVLSRQGRSVRACYTEQLRRQLGLAASLATGRVVIDMVVAPSGAVRAARIRRSTLNNAVVERCIVKGVQRLEFPAPTGGAAAVTFAMRFGEAG